MAKGDNSLTVKLTMTSSNLFPWNLNMARENTLTVPGTANGNAAKMGQGTISNTKVIINNYDTSTDTGYIDDRAFVYVRNTGSQELLIHHSSNNGSDYTQVQALKEGEFVWYCVDDGTMGIDSNAFQVTLSTASSTTEAEWMLVEMGA
jgi:hypothetical protein